MRTIRDTLSQRLAEMEFHGVCLTCLHRSVTCVWNIILI
jgi:hypothetical protein